ncbi:MAG: flagellar filament capping protein FliD [Desulfobaccales bacterium]
MATSSGISSVDTSYTAPITFSGLGSSVDFSSIIDKLVSVEGARITQYNNWKQEWSDKITALQTLNSKLTDFNTAVAAMDTPSQFQGKVANSSNTSTLTVSASTTATSGTHQVLINQMAQNNIRVETTGVASADTVINSSGSAKTFAFKYTSTGSVVSVSVADGATLTDLANAINASGANQGVTASVLNLGSGANPYCLMLQGKDSGAGNTVTIDATTTLDGTGGTTDLRESAFSTSQAAQNAQVRVDGYPPGSWIERSSNVITDVIPGVSLSLLNTSPTTPVQVTVNDDTSSMQKNVQSMVDKYNDVISYIKEQTKYDTTSGTAGILQGNYAVEIVKTELNAIGTGNAPGFQDPNDPFVNLSQIGITTDSDQTSTTFGQLIVDSSALSAAITSNPQAVSNLMSSYFKGVSDDSTGTITYYSSIPGITHAGIYDVSATVSGGVLTGGFINGNPATVSGNTLNGQNGFPEYGLAVSVNTTVDNTYTGRVRLQLGINGAFSDKLTDLLNVTSGPVNILIDNYNDIVSGIDSKIETEQTRISNLRSRLTQQFAKVDTILSTLNQQSTYLTQQLAKLSS